jgi:hypothetical protein
VASATLRPLYPFGKSLGNNLIGRCVGSKTGLETVEESRYSCIALAVLTSVLVPGEWSAPRFGRFIPF